MLSCAEGLRLVEPIIDLFRHSPARQFAYFSFIDLWLGCKPVRQSKFRKALNQKLLIILQRAIFLQLKALLLRSRHTFDLSLPPELLLQLHHFAISCTRFVSCQSGCHQPVQFRFQ